MRILPAAQHRLLDFVTVALFALAPTVLHLAGPPMMLAYALAVIHLALTLVTRFAPGGSGLVPFKLHGMIELIVGVALVIVPFALGWIGMARTFYLVIGVVILIVWAVSDYVGAGARTNM